MPRFLKKKNNNNNNKNKNKNKTKQTNKTKQKNIFFPPLKGRCKVVIYNYVLCWH